MPEQYLTPPPPHELLTAEKSFYARSGLFFPFVFSLVFALTACNGGGGSSSNDGNNGSSGRLNLSFSNTVIGMREFLLTVSLSNPDKTQDIVFIVSDSATEPAWDSVESNKAKITRAFSSSLNNREIYFSLTKDYTALTAATVVDLSKDAYDAPAGFMVPAHTYYVHAYDVANTSKATSAAITTADYPASLPPAITNEGSAADPTKLDSYLRAMWGMDMWTRRADGTTLNLDDEKISGLAEVLNMRTIEVRTSEVMYFPFRLIPPHPATQTICSSFFGISKMNVGIYKSGGVSFLAQTRMTYPSAGFATTNPSQDQSVLFTKTYSSNYYDIMANNPSGEDRRALSIQSDCIAGNVFYYPGFGIREIAE